MLIFSCICKLLFKYKKFALQNCLQIFMSSAFCIMHILSIMNCLVESLQITISASINAIKMTESIGRTFGLTKVSYKILVGERQRKNYFRDLRIDWRATLRCIVNNPAVDMNL